MKQDFLSVLSSGFISMLIVFAIPYYLNESFLGLESIFEFLYYCFFTAFIASIITYFVGEE